MSSQANRRRRKNSTLLSLPISNHNPKFLVRYFKHHNVVLGTISPNTSSPIPSPTNSKITTRGPALPAVTSGSTIANLLGSNIHTNPTISRIFEYTPTITSIPHSFL
ncbi:hypothetical protein AA313_de0204629 [Arthrobotrys entomopaga]|nr:hypothetical protein AA313_de0204629 [Arthrobotrys entomopaga]